MNHVSTQLQQKENILTSDKNEFLLQFVNNNLKSSSEYHQVDTKRFTTTTKILLNFIIV